MRFCSVCKGMWKMNITFFSCVLHKKNSWYRRRDSAMHVKGIWKMNIIFFSYVLHMKNSWYISRWDSAMSVKGNMCKMNITFFSCVLRMNIIFFSCVFTLIKEHAGHVSEFCVIGEFCVHHRSDPTGVGWNQGWTRKLPTHA